MFVVDQEYDSYGHFDNISFMKPVLKCMDKRLFITFLFNCRRSQKLSYKREPKPLEMQ